ncbi:MAG: hypothetical protein IKG80_03240, partial [Clostridia bacterium]|nr:hypothetical protein [Clostridia bacterium]
PYRFRPTGGSADVGKRKNIRKIVGASAAYNQLVDGDTGFTGYKATVTYDAENREFEIEYTEASPNGGYGLNSAANFDFIPAGHVCLVRFEAKSAADITLRIYLNSAGNVYDNELESSYKRFSKVVTTSTPNQFDLYGKGAAVGDKVYVRDLQVIDLTETFGAAVADAIASKESTLAGSGLAWIRSYGYLTDGYYPYNAGAFVSAKPSAHRTVGFNAWDEVWESGYIDDHGENKTGDSNIRSKNYIPVLPSTAYYVKAPYTVRLRYYDKDKNFIGITDANGYGNADSPGRVRTMPANARFLRFYVAAETYNDDICINLSHSGYRNGDYEAHVERTYPLADTELRGLLKVDESGNLYADGDTYEPDGTVTRRYYEVSSADCTVGSYSGTRWKITLPQSAPDIAIVDTSAVGNVQTSRYFKAYSKNGVSGLTPYAIAQSDVNATKTREFVITIDADAIATVEAAAAWVANHPFSILYECAESTETGTAYPASMICEDFGTEEFVDERAVAVPVGHETFYQANNADKLDHLPFPADADGDYIIHQSGKTMTLKATSSPLPALPAGDGEYNLKVTVSGGTKTLSWEAIS